MTSTGDSGAATLRQAIADANASADTSSTITFSVPDSSTITLLSSLPDISKLLTIDGATASALTIRGDGTNPIFRLAAGTTAVNDIDLENGPLEVGPGTTLQLGLTRDGSFDDVIDDAGALEKRGAARLTLLGANLYSGGTTITAGTLQGDTTSLQGDIANNAVLVFDQAAAGTFADVISGIGRVEKTGAGTLTLAGANTYTGGTTVSEGVLEGDTTSLQGAIVNNASVVFDQASSGTYSGDMSGSGSLEKRNAASILDLDGNNSYRGGTILSAGGIRGDSAAIQGDYSLAAGTFLIFEEPGTGTYSGAISGDGVVAKTGSGTLTWTGSNTFAGTTFVAGGTLIGSTTSFPGDANSPGAIQNDANLVFDEPSAATYAGVISGPGTLEKRGAGTLTFSADHLYTGMTTISAGALDVDGSLAGAVTVGGGGTLGGGGLVSGTVTVNGSVSPGPSIGAILNTGSVIFKDGAVFEVDVNDPNDGGDVDQLIVTGSAEILNASLLLRLAPGDYLTPVAKTILTSTTGTTGIFTPPSFAFLTTTLTPNGNDIDLVVVTNGATLTSVARTPNQRAIATALENAVPTPDLSSVLSAINTLSLQAIGPAYDSMAGEQLSQFPTTEIAIAARLDRAIQARIRGLGWQGGGVSPFAAGASLPRPARDAALGMVQAQVAARPNEQPSRLGGWIDGYGLLGDMSGDSNASDLDYTIFGGTLGVDYRLGQDWLVGAAGGYASSDVDFDNRDGSYDVDTFQGSLYVGWVRPGYHLGLSGRYATSSYDTSRDIAFPGVSRTATADFDGSTFGGHLEAGLDGLRLGRLRLQPLASLSWSHVSQDGYTEKGADALNLSVDNDDIDSLVSGLGFRTHGHLDMGEGLWLTPELRVRWMHEFGDDERRVHARLQGDLSGAEFVVRGVEVDADSLRIGTAWTVTSRDRLQVFARYDVLLNSDLTEHSVSLGVRLVW